MSKLGALGLSFSGNADGFDRACLKPSLRLGLCELGLSGMKVHMRISFIGRLLAVCVGVTLAGGIAFGEDSKTLGGWRDIARIYEPVFVGYTFDDDDQSYLDFSLSAMFPLSILAPLDGWNPKDKFPDQEDYRDPDWFPWQPRVYFAFSGRAGQYLGTRESSPVVGKRFNPVLALRWWQKSGYLGSRASGEASGSKGLNDYFELSYGHESNGQSVGDLDDPQTPEEEAFGQRRFEALQADFLLSDGDASIARDELSRGWDYIGARWASSWIHGTGGLYVLAEGRYYLDDGLLQGEAEEYNVWENDGDYLARYDGSITRDKVDGLRIGARYQSTAFSGFLGAKEIGLSLRTGYNDPFERITARVEVGFEYYTLWYRYGYNSDLVDYYRKDSSWGISIKIREF